MSLESDAAQEALMDAILDAYTYAGHDPESIYDLAKELWLTWNEDQADA